MGGMECPTSNTHSLQTYFCSVWAQNCYQVASKEVIDVLLAHCDMAEEMQAQVRRMYSNRFKTHMYSNRFKTHSKRFSPIHALMNQQDRNTMHWLEVHMLMVRSRVNQMLGDLDQKRVGNSGVHGDNAVWRS